MKEVRVFAPASVGNAIVGFDILGLALEQPGDEIVARRTSNPGLRIVAITGDNGRLPYNPELNTAGVAALSVLKYLGETGLGIELEVHKRMPFGSGLGSSAASAVGGAFAINALLDYPLGKEALLPFAMEGEQLASGGFHADNVAPSMLGGIVLITSNDPLEIRVLPTPDQLFAAVIHPHVEVLTKEARDILKPVVSLKNYIVQSGLLGGFITGLFTNDFELISQTLRDIIIEPQRAGLIPRFYEVQSAAMYEGALGCSISGAGPSIVALCNGRDSAVMVAEAMQKAFATGNISSEFYVSSVNRIGATEL
jgi:homoserine kinase